MIGTIRKHSKWLWLVIASLTIISFIGWNIAPANRNSGGGVVAGFGTLYGHNITMQEYQDASREFDLSYWFNNREWPDHNANTKNQMEQQIYLRLMLTKKAEALGIYATDEAVAADAGARLRSLGRNGQSVPIDAFVKQILGPEGLTADNFERFARSEVVIQQLVQTLGLTGTFITPQEVVAGYQRERQEVSAQIVFFSASNFLGKVSAPTPDELSHFYTNEQAYYRLPDRVQVNYVEFNVSNFMAAAEQAIGRTNLDDEVQNIYRQNGMESVPDAKTPEEAKAKIRDYLIRKQALTDAQKPANELATEVFNQTPVRAENLATVAKQKGLTVRLTAPFSSQYGPDEFTAPAAFTKDAFALTSDDPFAGPISSPTAVYVISLAKQLPTEIPSLDQIHDRVTQDYRTVQATMIAQRAGTNFAPALAGQLMTGHSFASACIAAGLQPETLPPFSLSTQDLPDLANRTGLPQVKQATFSTPSGHSSNFEETDDGGFIVYVQTRLPVDTSAMSKDLPQFTAQLRRQRENEAFNQWVQTEANHQLMTTPVFHPQTTAGAK